MLAMAQRGLSMMQAKRTIEALIEHGTAFVELPTVEDLGAVAEDLAQAGIEAVQVKSAGANASSAA